MIDTRKPLQPLREMIAGLPRSFWVLFAGTVINRTGSFVVPFLAIYLTRVRGFTVTQAGLVAALYGAGVMIASPVGGAIADRLGRRVTLLFSLGAGGAGMILLGFLRPLALIAPGAFVVAMLGEMYRPAMQAAILDVVPVRDRARAIGLIYWAINLGVSIGLSLGGFLATVSYTLLFVGDGVTTLAFGLLVWRAVPESHVRHPVRSGSSGTLGHVGEFLIAFRDWPFVGFLALNLVIALIFMQHTTTLPIDMTRHGLSSATYGVVMALNGALIVVFQPFLGPWLARRNPSRVLAGGVALVAFGFGLNALARTAPLYALSVSVWTMGEILVLPISGAIVGDLAPPAVRGRYQGAHGLSFGLAACVAPLAGTFVLRRLGAPVLWCACLGAGLAVVAIHLAWADTLTRIRLHRIEQAHATAGSSPTG
ncbi:MAG: MDR family MFS transporter [Candidatus Eisenbacteria bacterium]